MAKQVRLARHSGRQPAGPVGHLIVSFGCGMGMFCLLMVLFAFALVKLPLPPTAVRPLAGLAAAAGAATSGYVLAGRMGTRCLVCGLGCGVFYTLCLVAATLLMTEQLAWQEGSGTLPLMLVLAGTAGGAAASLKGGH